MVIDEMDGRINILSTRGRGRSNRIKFVFNDVVFMFIIITARII
jgi:hypothetical protein